MTDHQHAWRMVAHADGCHWWVTTAACECGATLRLSSERDLADPYAAVWMADESCARCRELMDGAAPEAPREDVVPA